MSRSPRGRTFSSGYDDDAYTREDYDGDSVSTGYTNATGRTGTSRAGVTTGPGGFVRLNKLVLFWTSAMTLTVLTILSYFTMALISLGVGIGDDDGENRRLLRHLYWDRYLAGDDAVAGDDAYAGDDAAADAGDDAYAGDEAQDEDADAGDDGNGNARQDWGEDNYEMGDDDKTYGIVDDAIATDDYADGRFGAFGGLDGFVFALSPQESIYLILVFVAVVGLDYYGLEALKELGNKAARFRVGAFAAFVLFLGNSTAAAAFVLGISKVCLLFGFGEVKIAVDALFLHFYPAQIVSNSIRIDLLSNFDDLYRRTTPPSGEALLALELMLSVSSS